MPVKKNDWPVFGKINHGFRSHRRNSPCLGVKQAFCFPVRVYYEDTDAGGVVYHANYLRFMERARNEWMRDLGWPVDQLVEREKCLFVVRALNMKFIKPARLGDALMVSTNILTTKKASMQIAQEVRRDIHGENQLLVKAQVELAVVSSETFRPTRLPAFLVS